MDRQNSETSTLNQMTENLPSTNHLQDKTALDWNKIFHGEVDFTTAIDPLDIVESWKQFTKKTYWEWKRFTSGESDIDTSIIPPEILQSWHRCREHNIDPRGEPKCQILTGDDLEQLYERNRLLIETSQPFLDRLFQSMKTTSFMVSLFDRDGYLLQVMQEQKYEEISKTNKWVPGAQWTEVYAGTSSISCILEHRKPLQVFGAQHYLRLTHFLTTSAAPIMDPDGNLLGGITLIALLYGTHPHTLGMAIAAAQAIENELKARIAMAQRNAAFDQKDTMAYLQKAIATFVPDAMIAVNNEGRIYAINEPAQKMLGVDERDGIGQLLHNLYKGEDNRSLQKIIDSRDSFSDMEIRLQNAQGPADYTLTCKNVSSDNGDKIGKIMIFSEIKRIRSLVTKFIGAKANFHFQNIICQNADFKKIIRNAQSISDSASNVLLLGESGTGKDIMAQAIHNASPRKDGPYVAINCAAIPRDLIASELFGYVEGAFTGSRRGGSQGKFELADGGSIFLDEIAETPLEIQAVLLRVIEDKCVVRVGGTQIRSVDVRIISATNRDLIEEVKKGNFRKDLYYRLNVFNIQLPPLRDRIDDIPLLVEVFIKKYSSTLGKNITGVEDRVWDIFMQYAWPGNVRELQNVVERMVNYASADVLTFDLIPPEIVGLRQPNHRKIVLESPEETEKRLIRHLLGLKFSKIKIAEQLNMSRATLFRKMRKYGLMQKDDA